MKIILLILSILTASAQLTTVPFTRTLLLKTNATSIRDYIGVSSNLVVSSFSESSLSTNRLKEIVTTDGYQFLSSTPDTYGIITNAVVLWPDGTRGVFSALTFNASFTSYDSFQVTYTNSTPTYTITQPAVSRDSSGAVTNLNGGLTISSP